MHRNGTSLYYLQVSEKLLLCELCLNIVYSISYSSDVAGLIIRNLDAEYTLKLHKELYCIE